jgi:hypothetical protein
VNNGERVKLALVAILETLLFLFILVPGLFLLSIALNAYFYIQKLTKK